MPATLGGQANGARMSLLGLQLLYSYHGHWRLPSMAVRPRVSGYPPAASLSPIEGGVRRVFQRAEENLPMIDCARAAIVGGGQWSWVGMTAAFRTIPMEGLGVRSPE